MLAYGDIATCSFHATKLFHTIEGGAVVTPNADYLKRMSMLRNFGHSSLTEFGDIGINGKNSEMHAAMGLCNIKHIPNILDVRRRLYERYIEQLENLPVIFQKISPDTEYNHAYFPIIFSDEDVLLKVLEQLNLNNIYPRRYFIPL